MAAGADHVSTLFPQRQATAREWRIPRTLWIGLAVVALASLAISLTLMLRFRAMGIFYLDDTLFNSDPKSMLEVLGQGERSKSILFPQLRNSIHPYLWLYFGPIIRIIAKVAAMASGGELHEVQFRATLGTFITPIVSMFQVVAFGFLMSALGFGLRQVLLASALNVVAFSNVIFTAIPEHFAISNCAITLMFLLSVHAQKAQRLSWSPTWIALGVFSAGVTITNAVILGIVHLVTALRGRTQSVLATFVRSFGFALSVALFVLVTAFGLGLVLDGPLEKGSVRDNFVPRYVRSDVWVAPLRALATLGNTIAPEWSDVRAIAPTPVPSPYDPALTAPFTEPPYPTYTLEPVAGKLPGLGLIGILSVLGMAIGAVVLIARGGLWRGTAFAALAVLAYNLVLHMAWGDEFFIYSQHWVTPALVLLAGMLAVPSKLRAGAEIALAALVIAIVWNNEFVIRSLIAAARAAAGLV